VSRWAAEASLQIASSSGQNIPDASAPPSRTARAAVLILVLLAVGLRLLQAGNTVDDAYITYRYSAHLSQGEGLVYNRGERVLGTSSPAYALALAGLARVTASDDFPRISLWLNALLDGLVALGLFVLIRRLAPFPGPVAELVGLLGAGLYAVDAKSVDFSSGGMESPLFAACLVGVALLLAAGRYGQAACLAGISFWVRPDGGLFIAALLVGLAWVRRGLPWRELTAAALPVGLALVLTWVFYGNPLPASLQAKAAGIYQLPSDHALRYLARHLAGMAAPRVPVGRLLPFLPGAMREYATLAATAVLPLALIAAGGRAALRGAPRPAALFLALYAALFVAAFSVANPFMMGWYYVPLETVYLVLASLGMGAAAMAATRRGLGLPFSPRGRLVLVAGVLVVAMLVPQLRRYRWLPSPGAGMASLISEWEKVRERDYLMVGEDLRRQTGGEAVVAGPEIGALGYAYRGPLLDTVGLVTPVAREYYPLPREMVAGNSAIPPDLVADAKPDFVVFLEIFGRKGLLRDPRFQRDYRLWRVYPSRTFGARGLLVYARRPSL
jgi:hypothetical protein